MSRKGKIQLLLILIAYVLVLVGFGLLSYKGYV